MFQPGSVESQIGEAGAAFTPADIGVHWWDAELSPRTIVGTDVSQVNDLIGSLHLLQNTVAARPDALVTINGLTAFDFDGGDSLGVSAAPSLTTAWHVFTVVHLAALLDDNILVDTGPATHLTTNDGFCLALQTISGAGGLSLYVCDNVDRSSLHTPGGVVGTGSPHLIECFANGLTTYGIKVDGVTVASGTPTRTSLTPDGLTIFGRHPASALNNSLGKWGMTVVCNQHVTGTPAANMLAYTQGRWGTP